jgi:hypothetical protein
MHGGVAVRRAIIPVFALPLFATTYYVDATSGQDAFSGTSPSAAWRSIAKVNASPLSPGDRVLFKRGERWRGAALVISASGAPGNPIMIGAYGTGPLPVIDGSQVVTGWTRDTSLGPNSSIYFVPWTFASNMVFQNDTTWLHRKTSKAAMTSGSFFFDAPASRLYVWTTDSSDPATRLIEATTAGPQYFGLVYALNKSWIVVENLRLVKSNYFGLLFSEGGNNTARWNKFERSYQNSFQAAGQLSQSNPVNVHVLYNEFTDNGIGRGYMQAEVAECVGINLQGVQSGSAVGNVITNQGGEGIQAMAGASNILMSHNSVLNPFGVGIYVLAGWGNGGHVTNTTIRHNTVELGPLSTGTAYAIATEHDSDRVDGVNFHHNVSKGFSGTNLAGLQFGSGVWKGVIRNARVHHNLFLNDYYGVIAKGPTDDSSNVFSNNIFCVKAYGRAYWVGAPSVGSNALANYNIDRDLMYGPTQTSFIVEWGTGTLYTLSGWQANTSNGRKSLIGDPQFANDTASQYTLRPTSPAIDAGATLNGVGQERHGEAPDIGLYEFTKGVLGSCRTTSLRNRYKAAPYP